MYYRYLVDEDLDTVYESFLKAFADYEVSMKISKEHFREMNIRRGFDCSLSVGAFDETGRMVGFLLSGVDFWQNRLTAYDLGTGVIPEFRRKGVAEEMFDFLLPKLRRKEVKQYLLEVIRSNKKAYNLYQKKGFQETRQLECFTVDVASLNLRKVHGIDDKISTRPAEPDWRLFESFWDWLPSWQNSCGSIRRSRAQKTVLAAYLEDKCVGYAVLFPESGDIAQIGVSKDSRRKGVGSLLMKEMSASVDIGRLAILNVDSSSVGTIEFLADLGFKNFVGQYEMILEL